MANTTYRTRIAVNITDRPGGLYEILKEFALRAINLTRIESQPVAERPEDFRFLIECVGHPQEAELAEVLESLKGLAATMELLEVIEVEEAADEKQSAYPTMTLDQVRKDIDIIDYQIIELLGKRSRLVRLVGERKASKEKVRDPKREERVLQRVRQVAQEKGLDPDFIAGIFQGFFDYFVQQQITQKEREEQGGN